MASKNARAGQNRDYMGHHEGAVLNTLPKHNYSNGFGWKKHKRHDRKNAFGGNTVIRKNMGRRKAGSL
jgi:hypothetical protein